MCLKASVRLKRYLLVRTNESRGCQFEGYTPSAGRLIRCTTRHECKDRDEDKPHHRRPKTGLDCKGLVGLGQVLRICVNRGHGKTNSGEQRQNRGLNEESPDNFVA